MKVVIANNRFFLSGGPEAYMFRLMEELRARGDSPIPFAVRYKQNVATEFDRYFLDPPSQDRAAVYYRDLHLTATEKVRLALGSAYSYRARLALSKLIADERPDLLYALAIVNMLSPSVIDAGVRAGVPVVMRLSDYNLSCPSYLHLRDGRVCRDCRGSRLNAIRYRCVQHSVAASATRVAAMAVHDLLRVYRGVSAFVTPSMTMSNELVANGLPGHKIHYIPTFIDLVSFACTPKRTGPIVYVGRLAREKGIDVLIKAHAALDVGARPPLFIVGSGPERATLEALVQNTGGVDVTFFGHMTQEQLIPLLATSYVLVAPSRWLENAPNTVYEAMACGKPVIASAIGSLMEQVSDGVNGYTVPVDDHIALSAALRKLVDTPDDAIAMGKRGRSIIERDHSPATHYRKLMQLFSDLTSKPLAKRTEKPC